MGCFEGFPVTLSTKTTMYCSPFGLFAYSMFVMAVTKSSQLPSGGLVARALDADLAAGSAVEAARPFFWRLSMAGVSGFTLDVRLALFPVGAGSDTASFSSSTSAREAADGRPPLRRFAGGGGEDSSSGSADAAALRLFEGGTSGAAPLLRVP